MKLFGVMPQWDCKFELFPMAASSGGSEFSWGANKAPYCERRRHVSCWWRSLWQYLSLGGALLFLCFSRDEKIIFCFCWLTIVIYLMRFRWQVVGCWLNGVHITGRLRAWYLGRIIHIWYQGRKMELLKSGLFCCMYFVVLCYGSFCFGNEFASVLMVIKFELGYLMTIRGSRLASSMSIIFLSTLCV